MRIAVAMSGGVDSSLTAVMLQEMGHEIVGVTLNISSEGSSSRTSRPDLCCSPESIEDARRVAELYRFPHTVVDVAEEFIAEIVEPFCSEYLQGRTPNPCIHCNARIKFKNLIAQAEELGCDFLATGHYARKKSSGGRFAVSMGADKEKDQSYFLFTLSQDLLSRIMFPLGDYHKQDIKKMARERDLPVTERPESQEICFVLDGDYAGFIERQRSVLPPPGDIIDVLGNRIGTHRGVHRYTIGQRRGMRISSQQPLYVLEIDPVRNVIIAGHREDLFRKGLVATEVSYMKRTDLNGIQALVKTRSTQPPVRSHIEERGDDIVISFKEPQESITPGQAAVAYDEDGDILGGGWIARTF
jgi:tRNA-specific 2-thiouridylase